MKTLKHKTFEDGVIADFDASEKMISMFIKSIPIKKRECLLRFTNGSLYSSGITEVEMRAVKESCERVNGKEYI
jgi:rod shape-determining protein MreB